MAVVYGGSGNDFIHVSGDAFVPLAGWSDIPYASTGDDIIYSGGGGTDVVHANEGNDTIYFGADLGSTDVIDGGAGSDILVITGPVTATLGANALHNIETISFANFTSPIGTTGVVSVTLGGGTGTIGVNMVIDGSALDSRKLFIFDASAETAGFFQFIGSKGRDLLTASQYNNSFDMTLGGNDTVIGCDFGNFFIFGTTLTAYDMIVGGNGDYFDDLEIWGSGYSDGLTLSATTIVDVDRIFFKSVDQFTITTNDGNLAAGQSLYVEAEKVRLADSSLDTGMYYFDGSAETDGSFYFLTGWHSDSMVGGAGNDTFDLGISQGNADDEVTVSAGGNDTAVGNGGDDLFLNVSAEAVLYGGDGYDRVIPPGSTKRIPAESGPLFFFGGGDYSGATWSGIEAIDCHAGLNTVILGDGNVAAGATLTVNSNSLSTIDGSAELDGHFAFVEGRVLKGGNQSDSFLVSSGEPELFGGDGDDTFLMRGGLEYLGSPNRFLIDGGAGIDVLTFDVALTSALPLTFAHIKGVERIAFAGGHSYIATTADDLVAAGLTMVVSGADLAVTDTLTFDGSTETDGRFRITGGAGDDTQTGGLGNDVLTGGKGQDLLDGGGGRDVFVFRTARDARAILGATDVIVDFAKGDRIDLSFIDAIPGAGTANDVFTFIGAAKFSAAGEIRAVQSGADTKIILNLDSDLSGEGTILLLGIAPTDLTPNSFIL